MNIAFCSLLFACAAKPEPVVIVAPAPPAERTPKALPDGSLFELLQAEIAIRQGRLDQALPLLAKQTDITQSLTLAKTTTRLAKHLQQYPAAANALALWLEQEPNSNNALDTKARALISSGKAQESFDFISTHPELAQQNLYVLLASETARRQAERLPALITRFQQTLAIEPENVGLLLGLGLTLDSPEAHRHLAKAQTLAPKDMMVLSIQAALLAEEEQFDEAISILQYALSIEPDNFGVKRQLGRILSRTDIVLARTLYKDLLEIAPNDSETLFILAQISMKLEFYEEAEGYLNVLQNDDEYRDFANYNLGLSAEQQNQLFIAVNHYDQIDSGPYLLISLERYGKIAAQLNGISVFEEHLETLKASNPDKRLAITVYHIEYLLRLKMSAQAKLLVKNGLDEFGNDSKLLYGQFLIAEATGDYNQATQSLQEILRQQPDNPLILNALGYTLSRHLNRHQEAKPLIEQALSLKPNDAAVIDSMGWVLLKLGDIPEATRLLMQAYAQSTNAEIAAHLGEALWLSNEQDQALEVWAEVYRADPSNRELLDVLKRFKISLPAP